MVLSLLMLLSTISEAQWTWEWGTCKDCYNTIPSSEGYKKGNVGIGTFTPSEKLEVNGNIKLSNASQVISTNRGRLCFSQVTNDWNHAIYNNHQNIDGEGVWDGMKFNVFMGASFRVGNASGDKPPITALYINSVGSVGIGMDNIHENFKMHIKGGNGSWKGGLASGGTNAAVTIGELSGKATIGGHTADLNGWATLLINPHGGNVGIGTSDPGSYKLAVEGIIGARGIDVKAGAWADFVFAPDYSLKSLKEVKNFIKQNGHLPDVPSEEEVLEEGINVSEMFKIQMQKIEELTLYIIELEEKVSKLEKED